MMTRTELQRLLDAAHVDPSTYDLAGGIPRASEGIVLVREGSEWVVRHFERGTWYTFAKYTAESDACEKVWKLLDDPSYTR